METSIDINKLSPMMQQYMRIKAAHKNHLLFFRMGDFYEMFFDDAVVASKELEITLTGKECGLKERAPMCGVPHHSVDNYIKKLVDKGFKIAICEQIENPAQAKGLVSRDVVRVITPGTVADSDLLEDGKNNYICCVYVQNGGFGICFADISTGGVWATQVSADQLQTEIINEIERFSPSEILYNSEFAKLEEVSKYLRDKAKCIGDSVDDDKFTEEKGMELVRNQFQETPNELGTSPLCTCALGVLIDYLHETQKDGVKRLVEITYYNEQQYMGLDSSARKNLELTRTMRSGDKKGSLLWVIDKTKTAMGKRLIRKIIEQPLINAVHINNRQEAVEDLVKSTIDRLSLIDTLSKVYDLERLMTKVIYGSINPRELRSLCYTIEKLPALKARLSEFSSPLLKSLNKDIDPMKDVFDVLDGALVFEPPVSLKDGGAIQRGFHDELDELRDIRDNGKQNILKIEAKEKERTGIPKLKINYNRVFGYYIEVTKSFIDKVPEEYVRKQTLTGSERYITQELKEYEQKVLTASERSIVIEQEIFEELRKFVGSNLMKIQKTAEAIAMLDVLCSFAEISSDRRYVRPEITTGNGLEIKDGRHPVVEAVLDVPFVPNDSVLDNKDNRLIVITGPNMAGKSTYMRQVALITLMAHIGCFVPASYVKMGIVDKIFTRVGASDDLSSGQSTFMVEMSEVAGILKNATNKSLIILDEIGRGTSTFDGMSIAKAVAEHILLAKRLGSKTLFATHYHELTSLESEQHGALNYNIAVKKRGDDITFLRKIVRGGVDESYGVAVAKLAGIPSGVIKRANQILHELESNDKRKSIPSPNIIAPTGDIQITFEDQKDQNLVKKIKEISLDTVTPIEAMNLLYELKKEVE